jgi:DNA-binding transcriptional LysR family regulator
MDKLDGMRVFVEVADQQSFVAASKALGRSAPMVTRSVALLEQSLGVKLFNRTTRHVRLTEAGRHFLLDAKRILDDLEQAEAAASGLYSTPKGSLSITAPVLFGQKHVMPILTDFLTHYPDVEVKTQLHDRVVNLLDEGLDVAVRIGHLKDSGLYAIPVGNVNVVVCGAPSYFEASGMPQKPEDLAKHEIIQPSSVETSAIWQFETSKGRKSIKLKPRLYCNQNAGAIAAAKQGFGITRLLSYQVGEEFQDGSLLRILQDYELEPYPVNIVHLEGRRANAKVRSFIDLAVDHLRANPFINHR